MRSNVKITLTVLTLKAFSLKAQGIWGVRDDAEWSGISACGGGISLYIVPPLKAAISVVMGHTTELNCILCFDLRKMAFVCVGPWCLCRATKGTRPWPRHVRGHTGALAPKEPWCQCCRAMALKQPESQLRQCRGTSWVTLCKGHHHHPLQEREGEHRMKSSLLFN